MGEPAQLVQRLAYAGLQLGQGGVHAVHLGVPGAGQAELGDEAHELLLGAVVEVPLETAPRGLLGGDQTGPRRRELLGLATLRGQALAQVAGQPDAVDGCGHLAGQRLQGRLGRAVAAAAVEPGPAGDLAEPAVRRAPARRSSTAGPGRPASPPTTGA